jgi:glycine oxidase
VKGQLLHLAGPPDDHLIDRNVRGLDVYLVARGDGRVIVGATVEERGFDDRVTAEAVHDLLRYAYELVPGIVELELTETVVGFRPGTPDNAPLIGWTAVEGLALATGHYRNGILLTPITADVMAQVLVDGVAPELIAAFSPSRFNAVEVAG